MLACHLLPELEFRVACVFILPQNTIPIVPQGPLVEILKCSVMPLEVMDLGPGRPHLCHIRYGWTVSCFQGSPGGPKVSAEPAQALQHLFDLPALQN